ncbi:hypothetical protein [Streptomyces bluensis]|uniref:AG2 protein n=1 Tax=Streptomyces bluensis TaxID=33897 RepID=A0ABW6UHP3_9ACTN
MIAYEQLYHLDLDGIQSAIDSWNECIRRYDAMDEAYDKQVVKEFDKAGWTSLDGTDLYARTQVVMANQEFSDAVTEAKGIRAVLQDAYDELRKYKSDLHQLTEDAKKDNITISATGAVSLTQPDPDGDKPIAPGAPGHLIPDAPSTNSVKIEFWEGRIAVVLAAADNADISASHALRRNTGKGGDEGFNDKTVKSVDQDESQRASKLLKKYEKGEKLSPAELDELDRLMSHNQKDPEFSRMLLDDLGPETTLRLAQDLEASSGSGDDRQKYSTIQNSLANSIGAANENKEFSDKWRADMRELGTRRPEGDAAGPYGYQTLTELLKHGDQGQYPPHMTMGLTDDIIEAEKDDPEIWDESQNIERGDDPEAMEIVDPVDNMLGIMSQDPDTATRYLDPEADGDKNRLWYLHEDRHWPDVQVTESVSGRGGPTDGAVLEEYDQDATNSRTGFGRVLEAATTGARPGEERIDYKGHTEAQARVMQDTITYLDTDVDEDGKVTGRAKGDSIPENMQKPLARALSDYTADTHDIIAGSKDEYDDERGRNTILGSGDDAHIANREGSVIRALRGVSDDPEAFTQIREAERVYAVDQMDRAPRDPGGNNENWNVPARDAANVLGAYNAIGSDTYLDQRDEKKQWADDVAKARYHQGGLPLTALPYVGDGAQRMLDQDTYDWSKDVKAEADLRGKSGSEEERAKGSAGTKSLIDTWVADRNRQGANISDNTERDLKQEAELSYLAHRGSALASLRGEY